MRVRTRGRCSLEEAFTYFSGVTEELLFDQMKAVITRHLRLHGGQLVLNLEFLRFARHWTFTPRACRRYRAQTKGKVERPIWYVRDNSVYGREFLGDGDLDEQRLNWLEHTANVRTHQTIKEQPRVRFERDERSHLRRPAERPYQSLVVVDPKKRAPKPGAAPPIDVER